MANSLLETVVRIACLNASAVSFPGEPRANFRRRKLAAEPGTPGRVWAVCVLGAGPETRAAGLRCLQRLWVAGASVRRPRPKGACTIGKWGGGTWGAALAARPAASHLRTGRAAWTERGGPAESALPLAASGRATLECVSRCHPSCHWGSLWETEGQAPRLRRPVEWQPPQSLKTRPLGREKGF